MPNDEINEWINHCQERDGFWYVKRLSGNDTQATGSHQAGPYIPNAVAFRIFPNLWHPETENPRISFALVSNSHNHSAEVNIIWYNNRLHGGTRNETRVTGLGGIQSPLLDPESTGAIAILFFVDQGTEVECSYWVCRDITEEETAESFFGPIEPGVPIFRAAVREPDLASEALRSQADCWLTAEQVELEWPDRFPTPSEVLQKAISLNGFTQLGADCRIVKRRECEYIVFQSVESAFEMPVIGKGFSSIDDFVGRANSILQRRKARSGRSLELQTKAILDEEGVNFKYQASTEGGNRPDFLFPSQESYDNLKYPEANLRMLAVKTTVRERWRQILEEADRVKTKHLLTLQEGVSENQFDQMKQLDVRLVVPKPLHARYPASVRGELLTLEDLISDFRSL